MDIDSNYLLFGESTSHLTSKWRGSLFNVENSIKREMRRNIFFFRKTIQEMGRLAREYFTTHNLVTNLLVWFYWMFYNHFSARSLLAKLDRRGWWLGWLERKAGKWNVLAGGRPQLGLRFWFPPDPRCCSTFLNLNRWTAFCMPR